MTAREQLHARIDALDEQDVASVIEFVRQMANSPDAARSGDLMSMLRSVQIDGPVDFSENLDLYMNGEKGVSQDIR